MERSSKYVVQDDKTLIEAFQQGDEFAFISLYNRYKGAVYAYCAKMLLNQELAQDVLQETFIRVYEKRDLLLKTDSFKSWLFTIARNQSINHMRHGKEHVSLDVGHEDNPALQLGSDTPVHDLEKSEQVALVNRFLAELRPDYREVLVLREYQNLTYEEIAAITRSTLGAVKSRLFKARRELAQYMENALGTEATRIQVD